MAKRKKGIKRSIIAIIVFIVGLSIFLYPTVSNLYYELGTQREISNYDTAVKSVSQEEIAKKLKLAKAYNSTIDASKLVEPFTPSQKRQGVAEYARMLEVKEKIGYVEIPRIQQSLPIYAGTSDEVLSKGVGHMEGTSLPVGGKSTHAVLAGHRGLPTKKIFTDLDKVKKGDVFFIHVLDKVLAYKVNSIKVIEPSDFKPILVQPSKDLVSLLTCTPLGINSHRLLVTGYRIPYTPDANLKLNDIYSLKRKYLIACVVSGAIILALICVIHRQRVKLHRSNQVEFEKN
ncbi:class C sortase [Alloscardovia venturai]|uniref:Class C sortase n=1 Tax=Alloscardovia venturai TaxID=1769421 RepID=A0ABW2Y5H7_9BIFI